MRSKATVEVMFSVINGFICDLISNANDNWTEAHVEMLKRLILSVLSHTEYAEVTDEMMEALDEQFKHYQDFEKAVEAKHDKRR